MRRARIVLALATLALTCCVTGTGHGTATLHRLTGVGVLDYSRKPTFKVGDYVRYAVTTFDADENPIDTYNLTVLIANQTIWWGERCFYVETWVEDGKGFRSTAATLLSYSAFDDADPTDHLSLYERKTVLGPAPGGKLDEVLVQPRSGALTARSSLSQPHTINQDTLGVDTVQTALGVLRALKVHRHQAWGNTGSSGDSTLYKERREDRTRWTTADIPITSTAIERTQTEEVHRSWQIGRSQDALPERRTAGGSITARLVAYGHGLQSRLWAPGDMHSFDDAPVVRKPAAAAGRKRTAAKQAPQ